jgi:hypothetical protein
MGPGTGDVPLSTSVIACENVLAPSGMNSVAVKVITPVPVGPGVTITSTVQVVEELERQLLSSEGVNTEGLLF